MLQKVLVTINNELLTGFEYQGQSLYFIASKGGPKGVLKFASLFRSLLSISILKVLFLVISKKLWSYQRPLRIINILL